MPEDKPIRDPGAAGKTSTHRPGHKAQPPLGVMRGPVPKPTAKQSEPELSGVGTPPGPLTPGNRG
jgi:hypothetical protein